MEKFFDDFRGKILPHYILFIKYIWVEVQARSVSCVKGDLSIYESETFRFFVTKKTGDETCLNV